MSNKLHKPQLNTGTTSSSTGIEPVSCKLSGNIKSHIEMLGWVNDNFNKHVIKALMIPKEMFGSK